MQPWKSGRECTLLLKTASRCNCRCVSRTVQHPYDDNFAFCWAIVDYVVATESGAKVFGQVFTCRAGMREIAKLLKTVLDPLHEICGDALGCFVSEISQISARSSSAWSVRRRASGWLITSSRARQYCQDRRP